MSCFEEIDPGRENAPHLWLLNSEADARQGNDPPPRVPYPLAIDAKHEVRNFTNPVFDRKVWSSTGFKSFASAKTVSDLPPLSSSWIQRLKPASHRTRLEDGHDMKDMCIDMKTNTNQCGTPAPLYENSRRSKQDFYSSPYAVVASDQYSRAFMTATSRSMEGAKVPQVPQPQVYVAPRFLPIVEALLPSYSQKANAGTEKGNLGNEVKQFSADERPKVSCSSIKAADFRSSFRSPSVRRHSSTLRSKYDCEFGKEYCTEKGIIGASSIRNKFSFGEKGIEESITNYACHDNMVLMKYKAMSEEIEADDFSCYQMHALDANKVCESQRKQPGICLSFNFHVAENALSCQRLEPQNTNLTEYSIQEHGHSSFGTIREAYSSESLLDCRYPCKLPYDCEATFESAEKRFCGNRNVSFHKAVQGDFIVGKTNNNTGAGAGADDGGHGVHCFAKPPELGYKADCAKEEETGHVHALQRQSGWRNRMGYKSCVRGMVSATEFPDSGSLPGPTKPYHGGLDQATGSYSDSCEKIEDGILPTLNEKTRLPDGHFRPLVLRKRSWDHHKETAGPLSNEFCEEESHAKHKLWMQRWCTASPEQHPNVNRELKTFVGISPFSEGGDGARTGSILFSSDSFALRPAKRMCHGSLQYTSGKILSGFQTARQYDANKTSFHFMKRFFNSSAAAMAIVGTTARKIHVADPQRKGLFGMWAAPKPSTGTIPLAEDETCKHFEDTVHKSLKKSLPRM